MALTLDLPGDVQATLAEAARQHGQTLEQTALNTLRRAYGPAVPQEGSQNDAKAARIRRFRQWGQDNGYETPLLSDEAISREAIYARE